MDTGILFVLTYGAETLTLTKGLVHRLKLAQRAMERAMLGVSLKDTITMHKTVADFYEGQSIFITGATGFLGKVLLQKLLYSCPNLDKVYILVRDKKDVNIQERLRSVLENPLFSKLRNERPEAFEKIVPIKGDITESKLGLSSEDEIFLVKKVSVVFHLGCSVNFKEKLDVAVNTNVEGTVRILDLTQRMEKIKCFVYVSTAFSNSNTKVIEEVLYPEPIPLEELRKLLKIGMTEEEFQELLSKGAILLLVFSKEQTRNRPNTYLFTKALAEHVVANYHGNVPSIIVRPSIVSSIKTEPVVGWIDNWFGATGHIATVFLGSSRVILTQHENNLDLIPVDYVSNLIIVAASKLKRFDFL
ncbi:putative fatty acyl-CoA reductase CG5065 [Melitaea cinxia]|uniref:putative fatty acyl-CoA reductase CG5065 n=1 Tax=Melitaea cinxia TaxID=113334 RepID=UPI001E2738B4|nr:putative fatty acyl-CoA reductase CG5065 [Melitaea cinxia]